MEITDATFDAPFEGAPPGVVLRIEAQGSNFVYRVAPIVARVGSVIVENLVVNLEGDGFVGQLRALPNAGDPLLVGYLDLPLIETGIVYNPPVG